MAKADIKIQDRIYSVACAKGQEERLMGLAEDLDARITQIVSAVGNIGEERLLLIAALSLLDELDAARAREDGETRSKATAALNDAAARIEAIAQRVEAGS